MSGQTPEADQGWKNSVSKTSSRRTMAEIAGVSTEQIEAELARQQGIPCPEAGLPDDEAILQTFGFSREDLYPDKTRRIYQGKLHGTRIVGEDTSIANDGRHDESGADVS